MRKSFYDFGAESDKILPIVSAYLLQICDILECRDKSQQAVTKSALSLFFAMVYGEDQFDTALIRIMRIMASNFIYYEDDLEMNGLPLSKAITFEFGTVDEYRENVVLKQGECAKMFVIYIMPLLLRIGIDILYLDSEDDTHVLKGRDV